MSSLEQPHRSYTLIGHDRALQEFGRALRADRMPHAWMLCGPRGIGKATMAFRLARFLLSDGHPAGEPSDVTGPDQRFDVSVDAPVFRRIAARAHPDLLVVERPSIKADEDKAPDENPRKAAEIPVDVARRIPPFMHKTPAEGGWRVVIVDDADTLNRNAANAILKVIEEPPERAVIFLVCSRPGAMLPTIRSRCRRLTLAPLPSGDVSALLMSAGLTEDLQTADLLGHLSQGSPGAAIDLLEGDAIDLSVRLTSVLGAGVRPDNRSISDIADRVSRPTAEKSYRSFQHVARYLVRHILRMAATRTPVGGSGQTDQRDAAAWETVTDIDHLVARGARVGLEPWLEVWEKMDRLFSSADRVHLDRRQIVMMVLLMLDDTFRRR